jgi:hypothetical protein
MKLSEMYSYMDASISIYVINIVFGTGMMIYYFMTLKTNKDLLALLKMLIYAILLMVIQFIPSIVCVILDLAEAYAYGTDHMDTAFLVLDNIFTAMYFILESFFASNILRF